MTRAKELVKLYKNLFKKMEIRYSFLKYLIGNEYIFTAMFYTTTVSFIV